MVFLISDACLELGLRARVILLRDLRVAPADAKLRAEIAAECQAVRTRFPDAAAIRDFAPVAAFQNLLRQVGVNPRKEKPSLERLLTTAHKKGDLPAINNLVDAYNLVSIRFGCSLGAHDLDRLTLPVSLRFLTGTETFTPLGGAKPQPVNPREFAYVDAAEHVLCRLDILQADFSKVTAQTRNAFLIVEGTASHNPETLDRASAQVQELVVRFCQSSGAA